jgi:hypothetical protein
MFPEQYFKCCKTVYIYIFMILTLPFLGVFTWKYISYRTELSYFVEYPENSYYVVRFID